jgi:DNA-binding CsgD family transcriptional regulator
MVEDEHTRLVTDLQAAAAGVPVARDPAQPWAGFLGRLQQVTQADSVVLWMAWPGTTAQIWHQGPMPHDPYAGLEPTTLSSLRDGRVYGQDDLPDQPVTAPQGVARGYLRALKVRTGDAGEAALWLHRPTHRKEFRSTDGQHLAALAPHLAQAATIWSALGRERANAAVAQDLVARLGVGWVMMDPTGTVIAAAPAAQTLAQALGLGLAPGRRLWAADPGLAGAVRRAIDACTTPGGSAGLPLPGTPEGDLRLWQATVAGQGTILGALRQTPQATHLPDTLLARHFGLGRSEARLAALLADGIPLKRAATHLGWTEETARSTSKQIYAKTGVGGLQTLVRKIYASAIWTCPPPPDV